MATNSTSFTKTPQAGDDSYYYDEDTLLQSGVYSQTTNYLTLDVMGNDLGGAAKTLFSIADGDGNPITSDYELLNKDTTSNGISAWEHTVQGNWIRLNNGKIEFALGTGSDTTGPSGLSINTLSATNTVDDSFVYAIRLGNGTLSEANVSIRILGSNDAVTLADTVDPAAVVEAGDAAAQNLAAINGTFVATDLDIGDTLTVDHGAATVKLDGADFTLPAAAAALVDAAAFSVALASATSNGGAVDVNYSYNPAAANLDFLAAGQSLTITYQVTVGDGSTQATQDVTFTITGSNDAPTISSGDSASVDENTAASTVLYTATASDLDLDDSVAWSLSGADAALLAIDVDGNVTLNAPADFESKQSYSFNVVATDESGATATQAVTLAVNNLDEVAPSITSGGSAGEIDENSGASQVVYTAAADDSADISAGVTFSLKAVDDFAAFTIDPNTGEVTLTGNPDFEAKSSYSFTVLASDGVNPATEQVVSLDINNLDEVAPTINSGATAAAIDENSGAAQVVYTATADDSADTSAGVTFSLKAVDDFAAFSIDTTTGEVTLTGNPDFEAKSSYSFTVLASDGVNPATEQTVTLTINDLLEHVNAAPVASNDRWFISDATAAVLAATSALLANDSDADGNVLQVTALSNDNVTWVSDGDDGLVDGVIHLDTVKGALAVTTATGSIAYATDGQSTDAQDGFYYRITDGQGGTAEAQVTVSVENIVQGNNTDTVNLSGESYQVSYIASGNGDDNVSGGSGGDTFQGGNGNDILVGGAGNDIIFGDAGDDQIAGNAGNDTIDGGSGNDRFDYLSTLDGNDILVGFDANPSSGQDTINLDALFDSFAYSGNRADHVSIAASGSDTVVSVDTDNNTSTYEVTITLANVLNTTVTLNSDVLLGS